MSEIHHCPSCGAELPAADDDAPCPACLMKLALEGGWSGEGGDSPTAVYATGFKAPSIDEVSSRFPQFEILELVGKGGMGAVYRARQKSLDRIVAIKVINPEAAKQPGFAERFAREARAMARLNHANIVTIHDFGQSPHPSAAAEAAEESNEPIYYLVMEYVDGTNLREVLREKRLKPDEVLAIVPPLCDALQYAHEEGIVHRDIKPENILIDRKGRVKVADFGLAKLLGRTPRDITLTEAHHALGTLHYMAPEQLERPLEVDHRADIYALGVTFYEMLTGELPLGRFALPSQKALVDVRLDEVVLRTLEREPERRYQHASDVKTAVQSCVGGPPLAAEPSELVRETSKRLRAPAYALIALGAMNLTLVGIYLVASLIRWQHQGMQQMIDAIRASGLVVGLALSVPIGYLAIIAGMRMLECRSHGLVCLAAVLVMVPCTPFIFGFPIGIWVLIVLNNSRVRAAFEEVRRREQGKLPINATRPQTPVALAPGAGPRMLALALGFASSSLVAALGAGMMIYAFVAYPPGDSEWAGFIGAGFGAFVGGIGGFVNCWSKLRTVRGQLQLAQEPDWNWLDSLVTVYLVFGIACLVGGAVWWSSLNRGLKITATIIGSISTLQGVGMSLWRVLVRRAARRGGEQPVFDPRLIVVAGGMMILALLFAVGVIIVVAAAIFYPIGSDPFWRWVAVASGCLIGGGGGMLGMWNMYRTLEGMPDWLTDAHTNIIDRFMYAASGVGVLLMAAGLVASRWLNGASVFALELIGGVMIFQAAIYLSIRFLMRRAARQEADQVAKS